MGKYGTSYIKHEDFNGKRIDEWEINQWIHTQKRYALAKSY